MNRSLKLSVLLALALGSTQAAAVQLGQVQVKSALGQPLVAEIPVTPSSPGELSTLSAQLAPAADYDRAGITDGRPSVDLRFGLAGQGDHRVIRITSAQPVNDPYLDLLVEVSTQAGRSVREVTILLDPPGSMPVAAPPAPAAQRARPAAASSRPATRSPATAAEPSGAAGTYGPVQRGDTLSEIAHSQAPAGVDTNQMLLALKQANPNAFYKDNINALKSGVVLRVPTATEAKAMSVAEAMAEVRRQNGQWSGTTPASTPVTVADAATLPGTSSAPGGGAKAGDRLALVPPKSGAGGSGGDKASGKLREELLRSQESLTTLQQQSSELKSRLKDLEDINNKNQRLLSLKDNEIAELQQKLAAARGGASQPAAPASTPANTAPVAVDAAPAGAKVGPKAGLASSASTSAAAGSSAAAPAGTASAGQPAAVTAKAPAKARPKPATPAARPVAEQAPWYMQTWVWEAAGGAVILLLLIAMLARRRKARVEDRPAGSSLADRFGAVAAAAPTSDDPDQDELLDQLAEHPDDIGLHLELVSLYYSRRDVDHFEAAAEAMHAHIADPQQDEWLDVVAMGEDLVPGHPLFGGVGGEVSGDEYHDHEASLGESAGDEALGEFGQAGASDLDSAPFGSPGFDESSADDQVPAMPPLPAQKKVSEYHFDFNLTPPPRQAGAGRAEEIGDDDSALAPDDAEAVADADADVPTSWNFEEPEEETQGAGTAQVSFGDSGEFSDDPIDTKLDLARAYLDMGDADGARAMLEEVMSEGSQPQKDAASGLLESIG